MIRTISFRNCRLRSKTRRAILLLVAGVQGLGLSAQTPMTLRECIDYAVAHNVQVRLSDLQRRSEEVSAGQANAARLPQVAAGASENLDFGRGLSANNTYVSRNTQATNFNVQASVPLFTGFRIPAQRKQAQLDLQAATADLEKVREDLGVQVAQAFLQVLYRQELVGMAKEQLALSNIQLARMERVFAAQKASGLDVSEARNTVAQDELQLVQAENNLSLALLDLSQLLEMSSPDSLAVVAPIGLPPSVVSGSPQQIFEEALLSKPSIRAGRLRIESAAQAVRSARSGYMPQLNLSGGLGSTYYRVNGLQNSSFSRQMRDNFDKSIGLSLNIPIFDRFQTRSAVKQAKLQRDMRQAQLDQTEKELYKEIQTAWYNAVAAQKRYEAAKSAERVAEESFAMMTKKYEYGKANSTQYNEQKTKYANAVSDRISAQYEYVFRTKILDFYSGHPIE